MERGRYIRKGALSVVYARFDDGRPGGGHAALAAKSGVSKATLSAINNRRRPMGKAVEAKLLAAGVTRKELGVVTVTANGNATETVLSRVEEELSALRAMVEALLREQGLEPPRRLQGGHE